MIGPVTPIRCPMASGAAQPSTSSAIPATPGGAPAAGTQPAVAVAAEREPILCGHCGRTASNGISCQGICVADSGY